MKKQTRNIIIGTGVFLGLLWLSGRNKLYAMVKPMSKRGCDTTYGCGNYGASRDNGTRTHNGQDYLVTKGQQVFSPITGKIVRVAYPYSDDLQWKGFVIENESYYIKTYYCELLSNMVGQTVSKGTYIAVAQNIAEKYPGIPPHIHVEVYKKNGDTLISTDPAILF